MEWNFHNEAPIYAQLMERIEGLIVSGKLKPGEKLPSVRAFAQEAGVNPNTMQKALTELERGGLIYSQRTAGHFVTDRAETIAAARTQLARSRSAEYLRDMAALGYSPEQTGSLLQGLLSGAEESKRGGEM